MDLHARFNEDSFEKFEDSFRNQGVGKKRAYIKIDVLRNPLDRIKFEYGNVVVTADKLKSLERKFYAKVHDIISWSSAGDFPLPQEEMRQVMIMVYDKNEKYCIPIDLPEDVNVHAIKWGSWKEIPISSNHVEFEHPDVKLDNIRMYYHERKKTLAPRVFYF